MTSELKPFLEDMLSMSTGSDGRTLQIHFCRPVTVDDRLALMDAHNAAVTRAVPDVPELVRYRLHWSDFDTADMEIDSMEGEYVLHSQAAAMIETGRKANDHLSRMVVEADQRAEAAEAKLAQYEAQHEKEMTEVIKERDQCEAWADKLAYAIGGEAIGEHSNMNSPWANALEIAASPAPAEDLKAENERLRAEFRKLMSGYVNTLENGMDRIRSLGGSCDDLDTMINNDPYLRDARATLNVEASNEPAING